MAALNANHHESGLLISRQQTSLEYGILTLQEEQEQLAQLPEQQLQEQGDILAEVGWKPVKMWFGV